MAVNKETPSRDKSKLLNLQYMTLCNQNPYCMVAQGNLRFKMKASDSVSLS